MRNMLSIVNISVYFNVKVGSVSPGHRSVAMGFWVLNGDFVGMWTDLKSGVNNLNQMRLRKTAARRQISIHKMTIGLSYS